MKAEDVAEKAIALIEEARQKAAFVVNLAMVYAYYCIG